ncbi:MAG TPA: hypothetical protein VFV38_31880 [Ktedonobacteraceae bacterium]|nr:hypothetical protein [Ktedonobacteraceae bacterium]
MPSRLLEEEKAFCAWTINRKRPLLIGKPLFIMAVNQQRLRSGEPGCVASSLTG